MLPKLLADVAREATVSLVAARIATAFIVALEARTVRVYLTGIDRRTLHLTAAKNVDAATLIRIQTVDIDDALPAAVAARLGLVQMLDADEAPTFGRPAVAAAATRAGGRVALALPLFAGAATVGAVSASFDELSLKDCAVLSLLSDTLGTIVEGARMREEVARLEANERKRNERLAFVVHELRQPLNVMVMGASFLTPRTEIEKTALDKTRAAAGRLERLISDLGDVSLIESGTFELRVVPTDIVALVRTTVASNIPAAPVTVEGEIPRVDVDPQRVEQVLANLLVNALKYGQAETVPRVGVVRRGGAIVISVTNDGVVIPDDERARVFEPYFRGKVRRPGTLGLGLGLHICRKLVEAHGGRIWTDDVGSCTRFSFSLPVRRADTVLSGAPPDRWAAPS